MPKPLRGLEQERETTDRDLWDTDVRAIGLRWRMFEMKRGNRFSFE